MFCRSAALPLASKEPAGGLQSPNGVPLLLVVLGDGLLLGTVLLLLKTEA